MPSGGDLSADLLNEPRAPPPKERRSSPAATQEPASIIFPRAPKSPHRRPGANPRSTGRGGQGFIFGRWRTVPRVCLSTVTSRQALVSRLVTGVHMLWARVLKGGFIYLKVSIVVLFFPPPAAHQVGQGEGDVVRWPGAGARRPGGDPTPPFQWIDSSRARSIPNHPYCINTHFLVPALIYFSF